MALALNLPIRSPDDVKVVLEANFVTTAESESRRDLQNKRILAVVSHKDEWDLTEEGALFVYKYKQPGNGRLEDLEIQAVLPIYGKFSIVMSQMRRETSVLLPTSSTSHLDKPRAVLSLSVTPAEGISNEGQPPTFLTHDIQKLRSLVAECKRLKQISDSDIGANTVIDLAQSTTHFSWLKSYLVKQSTIASLASLTQDLRQVNRPLVDRLSLAHAGLSGDDHADILLLRDEWIRTKARETSRKGQIRLTLRLGTFNVNGKMPSQDLFAWIQGGTTFSASLPPLKKLSPLSLGGIEKNPFDRTSLTSSHEGEGNEKIPLRVDTDDPDDPDIFVLGFQELDLSAEALIYYASTAREDAWCHAIFAALGEKAIKYEKLVSRQLVGMLVVVLVRKSLKRYFGNMKTSAAGSGILGLMGNKGGTAIRLSFTPPTEFPSEKGVSTVGSPAPITFTFVNAHLAAFDEMMEKRNADFHDLSKRLNFNNNDIPPQPTGVEGEDISPGPSTDLMGTEPSSQPLSIYETDVLFWMGDLNYRMDIPDHEMRKTLRDADWGNRLKFETLLRFDQLKKAIQSKRAFEGFQEAPITYAPTYRFDSSLSMDNMGYDLKRKPAWTDRILYMRGATCQIHQLSYTSHPQIIMSDHRPVSADFTVDADVYDAEELQDSVQTLFNQVDDLQRERARDRGELKVNDTYLDFEKISYDRPVERKFSVKNTSTGPRAFRFVPQVDSPIHPEWLQIHPMTGILLSNETIQITVRVYIDNAMALILNQGPRDLSATLILHTVLGKDHFISVSGEYNYTCFANKVSRLTRLRGPIRSMASPNDLIPENRSVNAPREIMRLVNWMMACTLNTDALFFSPADKAIVNTIRECLDTGDDFPYSPSTQDPELPLAFSITLLRFLESLPESIVPVSLHPRCLEMNDRDEAFELLDALPPSSVNVWISITAYLHFICQSSQDKSFAERIATILAPVLMRDDPLSPTLPIPPKGKSRFLLYFIS